ncbi:MAG: Hsp20/alpha crystallin family protein [Armatimonadetes bacterium]|jgi:HSP20 family protein|nr:Hsp20/alpha crystallin family protein [Armatimonadota bacterium]
MTSLVRINPFEEMRQMTEMFDRLFEAWPWERTPAVDRGTVAPMDVLEKDNKLIIRAALPGVKPEDVKVNIENNVLTIEGEVKQEHVDENTRVYRRECAYGKFTRSLRLADNLNFDQIDAQFHNGIVEITIPKIVEEKKTISIPVRTA